MSYNLFLDDERSSKSCRSYDGDETIYDTEEFIEVSSFDEFYKKIKEDGIPKFVSFDYKINGLKTGLDCAEFLKFECEEQNVEFPKYAVHSCWPGIKAEFKQLIGK